MRKLILLTIMVSLFAVSAWGDDVSVVETFSQVGEVLNDNMATDDPEIVTGDLCKWEHFKVRRDKTTNTTDPDVMASGKLAWWTSGNNSGNFLRTKEAFEGGIKHIDFEWKQFTTATGATVKVDVTVGSTTFHPINYTGGNASTAVATTDQLARIDCNIAENAQIIISNASVKGTAAGRILIGDITITPYLYYMQKSVTIGLPNKGYINRNLLDQIEEEHTISYTIDDDDVADINSSTGAITPKTPGTTWVRAHWGDVSTSYELTVDAHIYLEAFSKNESYDQLGRNSEGTWDGDVIASWNGKELRRDAGDTIGYFIQGTWMRTLYNGTGPQAYLKSANELEGGMKALSFNWTQWGSGVGCSLQMCASYGGETPVKTSEAIDGVSESHVSWPFEYEDESEGDKTNEVLEIKNISTREGNKDPRIVISGITITPWLLYYTKEAELNMRVESAEPTLTFKNEDLIDNTGASPTYSILGEPSIDVQIDAESGTITVADRFQTGDIEVQAKWSEVTTTYTLHVKGKTVSNASFTDAKVYKDISAGSFTIACSKDAGTPSYTSSNTSIATVDPSTGEVTLVGVGQDTITATIAESETVGGSTAYYILYVTDNSEKVQVEAFSQVPTGNAATHAGLLWSGDVYDWRVSSCGGVRKNNDVFASDQDREGIWMGTPDPNTNYSSLTVENGVEGGIKHIWFYCEQPYNTGETNYTLKPVVYLDEAIEANKVADIEIVGTSGEESIAANRKLFGASNVTKSNSVLIIRNESFKTSDESRPAVNADRGRFLLDEIHITPWLLYTTKAATLDMTDGTMTYKNTSLIDNTEEGHISYTSSDVKVATVANDGTVTATGIKGGTITIKATWDDEGTGAYTTYELTVIVPEVYSNKETFNSIITTANYTTLTGDDSKQGDVATWSTLLGGFNPDAGDAGRSVVDNCARFKARYSNETGDSYPYIESSTIPGGIKSLRFKCQAGGNESTTTWIIKVYINEDEFSVPAESIPTNANQGWKSIEISDINVAGDFVIRFENQSTISNYTEGNKGRLLIDDIEWEGLPIALEDDESNATLLGANNGYKRNVLLADRTIRMGGYNTLCLPFALSAEQLAESPLAGGKVYNFTNAYLGADNLDIRFEKVNAMEAGKPYLVTVPADVENPVFEGVTISDTEVQTVEGGSINFIGTYAPKLLPTSALYVVGNELRRNSTTANVSTNAFRAYFDVPTGSPALAPGIRMRIVSGQNTATDVESIQCLDASVQKVLRDGHLYILRDGRMYNAQGLLIKE